MTDQLDTRPLLQFKLPNDLFWYDAHSPTGTYGRHGSLEAYKTFLESRGRQTRVIPTPIKRCPTCQQVIPD